MHFSELSEKYLLPSAKGEYGSIAQLMDKDYMSQVAQEIGVLSPQTWIVTKDRINDSIESIIYPCLCKPLKSASGSPVGGTYIICNNQKELRDTAERYFASGFIEFLCEQYINSDVEISVEDLQSKCSVCLLPTRCIS